MRWRPWHVLLVKLATSSTEAGGREGDREGDREGAGGETGGDAVECCHCWFVLQFLFAKYLASTHSWVRGNLGVQDQFTNMV